ncbi:hypothetical protein [Streptomyces sp. A5-4]|uniref:hypothetical protein n=1 Tax=Streptomyces sp. A5-4 TaxID=3384771 RepID=UPI003DA8E6E7
MIAIVSAAAVVVAAGVAGFLVLSGGEDDNAQPKPTGSASAGSSPSGSATGGDNPRAGNNTGAVVPGWKTVARGAIAYDVPPQWGLKAKDWVSYVADDRDPEETPLVGFGGAATLKEQWCRSDDDRNGSQEDTALATVGTRTEGDATSAAEAAASNAELWVYGGYAQPDKNKIKTSAVEDYTTASGIKGSLVTATSAGVDKTGKCATDGKAVAFVFRNADNDFKSWTFIGAKGVQDEVPDATVRKILSTLRLSGGAKAS